MEREREGGGEREGLAGAPALARDAARLEGGGGASALPLRRWLRPRAACAGQGGSHGVKAAALTHSEAGKGWRTQSHPPCPDPD